MKNKLRLSVLTAIVIAAIVSISFVGTSCKKKMDEHQMDITMTYTPNPAIKDSLITFTFTVMHMGDMTSVMSSTCEINSSSTVMGVTESSTGMYTGTHKFTTTGANTMLFKYMHDNADGSMSFPLTVQ